jgi:hypothetical protein
MMIRSIAAACAVAASLFAYTPAQADVDFDIGVGFGFGPGWGYDPGYYYGDVDYYGISCGEGRRIVRHAGFRRVRTLDCRGRTFAYSGWRHGDRYIVRLSRRSGRIVDVD